VKSCPPPPPFPPSATPPDGGRTRLFLLGGGKTPRGPDVVSTSTHSRANVSIRKKKSSSRTASPLQAGGAGMLHDRQTSPDPAIVRRPPPSAVARPLLFVAPPPALRRGRGTPRNNTHSHTHHHHSSHCLVARRGVGQSCENAPPPPSDHTFRRYRGRSRRSCMAQTTIFSGSHVGRSDGLPMCLRGRTRACVVL
jgi:hypothetical protein